MQNAFIETAPVGIIVTSLSADGANEGGILVVNSAAASIFNILPEALLGQKITVLGADSGFEALLVEAAVSESGATGEIILGEADQPHIYVHAVVNKGDYLGQPALFWWLNDISEVRRTEEEWKRRELQLQAVIEAAEDAVFEIDLSTGSAVVSPRFWQMLGVSHDEAVGRQHSSSEEIYHYVREDFQMDFATSLRPPTQDGPYEWTGPLHKFDGSGDVWLYMRGRATNVATEPRIIGVITDISAQKAVEENLRKAKESAEEANRAKSAFLATMSHEIRTPMTAILGSLEYLLDTPLAKEQEKMAAIARDSGQSLLAILNDILDLSKIEAGKLTLEAVPTSPRILVQGACDAAQIVARQKNIYLRCRFAEQPPAFMLADPVRVRQVLVNLVNNAVKFTSHGGVSVIAEFQMRKNTAPTDAHNMTMCVVVQDTGIGLSLAQQEKLFKPFSQADDSTTRKFGGTGLGLSICQKLVERMGGQMGVYSHKGQGAAFWFSIPVGSVDAQVEKMKDFDLKGMKVLLVDNDPESARQISAQLVDVGGRVTIVPDGRHALLELVRNAYGLVLLDQTLPDSKGLSLVPAMRALASDISIVLYTSEPADKIGWVEQEGGAAYLSRETPYQQFLETMESYAIGAPILEAKRTGRLNGRVLIAEDTASVRQILELQTKGLGLEVDFAENGRIALDKMNRARYDLVISDLHMPEVDGYGLVHEWRAREAKRGRGEHLPIVALTADVLIGDQNKFIAEGFDDYMAKPVSRDALRNLIARWLSRGMAAATAAAEAVPVEAAFMSVMIEDTPSEDAKAVIAALDNQAAPKAPPAPPQPSVDAGRKPVDHDRLIEILGLDDVEIISEAMQIFIETADETYAALAAAYAKGDVAAAKGPAHSLKGSARMAGAVELGEIAAELDAAAKKGELLPDRLVACKTELDLVLDYIKQVYIK